MAWYNPSDWSLSYNPVTQLVKGTGNAINGVGNTFGLWDTNTGERMNNAWGSGIEQANTQLSSDLAPIYEQYQTAMGNGRNLDQNLSWFENSNEFLNQVRGENALAELGDARKAMTAENIQSFVNPYSDFKASKAMQQMAGRAGGALQSSAANDAMYNAAADSYGQDWNTAVDYANKDFGNKHVGYQAQRDNLAGIENNTMNTMQAKMTPFQQWQDLKSSEASQKYNAEIAKTQAAAQAAGEDQSWLMGGIVGGIGNLLGN